MVEVTKRNLIEIDNRKTNNSNIAVENVNLCGKNMRYAQFSEICGNNRNMRQSHKTGIVHHAILHYWKRDVTSTQSNPIQHTQPSGYWQHFNKFRRGNNIAIIEVTQTKSETKRSLILYDCAHTLTVRNHRQLGDRPYVCLRVVTTVILNARG